MYKNLLYSMARVDPLFTSGRPRVAPVTTIHVGRTPIETVEGRPATFMERLSTRYPITTRLLTGRSMPFRATIVGRPSTPYSSVYPASIMDISVPVAEVQLVDTAESIDQSEYLLSFLNRISSTRIPFPPTFWRIVQETFETGNQSNLEIINNIFRITQLRGDLFQEEYGELYAPNSLLRFPPDFQADVYDFVVRNGIHRPPQRTTPRDREEDIEVDALDVFYPAELANEPDILNLEDYITSDEEGAGLRRFKKKRRQKSRRK